MSSIFQALAEYAVEIKFEELPMPVIQEAKRILLDSIGCALGAATTDKGKMDIALAKRLGGPMESSIIGAHEKVSCSSAALANGELINAMDYDNVLEFTGHVTPHVIPAPLAVAETVETSGKDLILAIALANEFATRIVRATKLEDPTDVSNDFSVEGSIKGNGKWQRTFGHSICNFGATAGVGKILNLNQNRMAHALGITSYYCQLPVEKKFLISTPAAMTKYTSPGWQSTGAVIAGLLAEMGYIGDTTVFDNEYGFGAFSSVETWRPNRIMESIGDKWYFIDLVHYKAYPVATIFQSLLDGFISIIDKENLMPEDIESIHLFGHPTGEGAAFTSDRLTTHIDAQFNAAYIFSVAAHRIKVGVEWQDLDTIRDPNILNFMKKVSYEVHPEFMKYQRQHPLATFGVVEVKANGRTYKEERMFAKGANIAEARFTDEELVEKFKHNASRVLTQDKIDKASNILLELETVRNISEMMKLVTK
jgi:2-methylcitrate dehydratase PrpD